MFQIFKRTVIYKNYLINSKIANILGGFEKFQGNKVNEGQILNFYKHFFYKNFVMNFKISGFVGFAGWFYKLDFIKVTGT